MGSGGKGMPELGRLIEEARRIMVRCPQAVSISRLGRFGDFYVRVGSYRVYFRRDDRTGFVVEGSEKVVRYYPWTPWLRLRRYSIRYLTQGVPHGLALVVIILALVTAASVDAFGVRSHLALLVPRMIMSFSLNVPVDSIKEAGGGWYCIKGQRVTIGDKTREPLTVYYHPGRWFKRHPDAVKVVRQRVGSDGRSYGTSTMSMTNEGKRLFLHKDAMAVPFERDGNVFRYKTGSLFDCDSSDIASDEERIHRLAGEEIEVRYGTLTVTDIEKPSSLR